MCNTSVIFWVEPFGVALLYLLRASTWGCCWASCVWFLSTWKLKLDFTSRSNTRPISTCGEWWPMQRGKRRTRLQQQACISCQIANVYEVVSGSQLQNLICLCSHNTHNSWRKKISRCVEDVWGPTLLLYSCVGSLSLCLLLPVTCTNVYQGTYCWVHMHNMTLSLSSTGDLLIWTVTPSATT